MVDVDKLWDGLPSRTRMLDQLVETRIPGLIH